MMLDAGCWLWMLAGWRQSFATDTAEPPKARPAIGVMHVVVSKDVCTIHSRDCRVALLAATGTLT